MILLNIETDVVVIGGGGAGAMAAYAASKKGVGVALVLKGRPQHCGSTIMAPGAIAGVGSWRVPGDSQDIHFSDTVKGGSYLNEQTLVRIMVEETPDLILELERMGALWQRSEDRGSYNLRIDGGHSFPRCPFLEDRTGREMTRAMFGELEKRNVTVIPNVIILRLIKSKDKICGAVGLSVETGEPVLIRSKAVILACGGAGNLYQNTSNPTDVTGDGYALALEAGATLTDMEFVQFFPLGFLFPSSLKGALGALLFNVHLLNNTGDRFMEKYDPVHLEQSTRDKIVRAIFREVNEGRGTSRGGVFADMTYHEPGYLAKIQPALCETYQKIGIDPSKDYLEVAPTCHFMMGGVKVDEDWQSSVPGLFIAGENAAGLHGANRLSQNALSEILVSGSRAGQGATRYAGETSLEAVDPREALCVLKSVESMSKREKGIRPIVLRNKLRGLMWENAGVFRTQDKLQKTLQELEIIQEELENQTLAVQSRRFNQELMEGLENRFLVTVARCVVKAALLRTESRGAHYREDYPITNNKNWLCHLEIRKGLKDLECAKSPVNTSECQPEEGSVS